MFVPLLLCIFLGTIFLSDMSASSEHDSTVEQHTKIENAPTQPTIHINDDPLMRLALKNPGRFNMKPGPGAMKGGLGPHRRDHNGGENGETAEHNAEHGRKPFRDWSHLVGKHSDEAKSVIGQEMPGVRAVVVPEV
jgi:hypothetical protein